MANSQHHSSLPMKIFLNKGMKPLSEMCLFAQIMNCLSKYFFKRNLLCENKLRVSMFSVSSHMNDKVIGHSRKLNYRSVT